MIAIIAHDSKKLEMIEFVAAYLDFFKTQKIIATGNTGAMIEERLELDVDCVAHGPYGGDLIIGGKVAEGLIEAVIFFRDPLTAQPHEPDISALMRVCDVHEIPLATNLASARAIVDFLQEEDL